MADQYFVDKVLNTTVQKDPWQHQIVQDSLPTAMFARLQQQCKQFLHTDVQSHMGDVKSDRMYIFPEQFSQHGIDLYDELQDVATAILHNAKRLTGVYSNPRWYNSLTVYAHIAVVPPMPADTFNIHEEAMDKIWSSVTYVAPEVNVGTKMYTKRDESAFVAEAEWRPNNSFIFCGQKGVTWHKFQSDEHTNRISLNLFLMSDKRKKYFV